VRIDSPFQRTAPARIGGGTVTFEPSSRTAWHTHPLGQTLIVTAGCGRVQRDGGPIQEIRAGLEIPRATWLTFRRTYSSWSHDRGVPGKVVAQLMGHANVDTTLNVYTQVLDGSVRAAVEKIGDELFTIVHKPENDVTITDL
jgi:hypothetical protein